MNVKLHRIIVLLPVMEKHICVIHLKIVDVNIYILTRFYRIFFFLGKPPIRN